MRVGIIGLGGVGRAFVQLLIDKRQDLLKEGIDIQLIYILKSSGGIHDSEGIDLQDLMTFTKSESNLSLYPKGGSENIDFDYLIEKKGVEMIVETTPTNKETGEPALTHVKKCLQQGIHVITANKGPVMLAYKELNTLAVNNKVQLGIGCTTGGALPTINSGMIDMAGANITSIRGILNGTTNFILKEMEEKQISFETALKVAQQLGIAETDPTLDIQGWDTATKLLILTNVLMDEEKTLKDIYVEGVTNITVDEINKAKKEGKKYKLIGKTIKDKNIVKMSVKLEKIDYRDTLYNVDDKNKAVKYTSNTLGDLTVIGGASGVTPAAASILRDLINIKRGYNFSREIHKN
ncbi:MAG: homoserine dehydrogenase [Clostridiaceae bacterium]|nr:homoserine dehydrogenase [Clostridiaceae bacterium]